MFYIYEKAFYIWEHVLYVYEKAFYIRQHVLYIHEKAFYIREHVLYMRKRFIYEKMYYIYEKAFYIWEHILYTLSESVLYMWPSTGKHTLTIFRWNEKNQRTTNEQRTNVPNVSTNYPNVSSIWTEKYERVKAKIHTIFWTTLREYSNERYTVRVKLLCNASPNCNNYYKNNLTGRMCVHLHSNFTRPLKLLIWIICLK